MFDHALAMKLTILSYTITAFSLNLTPNYQQTSFSKGSQKSCLGSKEDLFSLE